ncbi:septal ring lytic transglycosylase RlpA family protein [Achromobacter sp. F4_2707]|uniref:septal ring lytic transglycosylase RlpA family protein n=1 Tax=Achromobacter sp. F4_2707 TaxID=3114286 RepID=UPI0039C5F46E
MTTTPSPSTPWKTLAVLLTIAAMLAGCGSSPKQRSSARGAPPYTGGGYYKDDGPGRNIPANVANTPDAVPRIEPHNSANFRPYTVLGQRFVPVSATTQLRQRGVASWYGRKFHGQKTANGETYDMYAMTAAHPTLPLPSYARVTHVQSGRSIIVRVNDRGPFLRGRIIDLSYAAAAKLGIIGQGSDVVEVEAITHADIRKGLNMAAAPAPSKSIATQTVQPTKTVASAAHAPAPEPARASASPNSQGSEPDTTPAPIPVATSSPHSPQEVAADSPVTPDALAALDQQTLETLRGSHSPAVTQEPSEGIYLQFGAFGSYISADQLANRLNNEIAHVETRNARVHSGQDLHRVRIGPYPSRTAAVNAAVRIQEATGLQPTLAQR